MTWYSFKVLGRYDSCATVTISGHIKIDGDDYPMAAFDLVVKNCQDMTPGLIVDTSKPNQVILQKLKRAPRR